MFKCEDVQEGDIIVRISGEDECCYLHGMEYTVMSEEDGDQLVIHPSCYDDYGDEGHPTEWYKDYREYFELRKRNGPW